jgi:citrate synthase
LTEPARDQRFLSAREAARLLGVKPATLYAYVSRGLLRRTVATDGRTSLFDPTEIEQLRQGRRANTDGELRTLITTQLTRVDDHGLWIRGHDLVSLVSGGAPFTAVVDLLWDAPPDERWDLGSAGQGPGDGRDQASLLDALRIVTARQSASDPLRHDLSPRSVRSAGRRLITALALGLPPRAPGADRTIAAALWRRLSASPADPPQLRALDAALGLLADHGLAGSTFAARIAASVRADPYSVVCAGLGVIGGTLHGAASATVHELLVESETTLDPAAVIGAARRRLGVFPGFGHSIYTEQDPRYGALMGLVVDAWAGDGRLATVYRMRDVVGERTDAIPNVDLSLGALTFLAGMPVDAGEVIFAIARTAGWLAHAIEEYAEQPLRFRARARYEGPRPPANRAPAP